MSGNDDFDRLVAYAAADIDGIVERVLPAVRLEVSGPHVGSGLPDEELVQALTAVLHEILKVLGHDHITGAPELGGIIRRRFGQGVALLDLLHNYRVGAAAIWEQLYGLVADDLTASRALLLATPRVFAVIDHFSLRAHKIYQELEVGSARRHEQLRATLLDIVLSSDPERGAAYWDSAAALGIPRSGHFLILDAVASSSVATETDWEQIVAGSPGVESVWFRLGPRFQVGLVALKSGRADAEQVARPLVETSPVTVGVSAPFTTLSDCRKARAQASVAAAATSPIRPLVRYDHDVLDVLMASSPAAAETLVQATLGAVLTLAPERARILVDSVRIWLNHNQSVAATAADMHCHRNTVNYRLRRFEEMTGRSLSDKPWLAQVYLAVSYIHVAGEPPTPGVRRSP